VALDLYGQQITTPLHLHLADFHLPKKYRGQKAVVHYQARPLPYFYESLERLGLNLSIDFPLDKSGKEVVDQELEDAIHR
jgi:hypothetical protein